MEENNVVGRDIVITSYYVISYFENHNIKISHLKLQKLMYFLEAIYMNAAPADRLFNTEFFVWPYGPVSKELYNKYKVFGSAYIKISEAEKIQGQEECQCLEKYVKMLFEKFGTMTPADLVTLTHVPGSPWHRRKSSINDSDIGDVIPKLETREWFGNLVHFGNM